MESIIRSIQTRPFFAVLIPVFFVLHGFVDNFGLVTIIDSSALLAVYLGGVSLTYLLVYMLFHDQVKAALITTCLCFFYFFFGALYDFLQIHATLLGHYSVLLPSFFILLACIMIYLKKANRSVGRLVIFLNVLLIAYLVIDLARLSWKLLYSDSDELSVYDYKEKNVYKLCKDCLNPDIYFLLFDEYSSTGNLRQSFHYDNSSLDSFLMQKGFFVHTGSYSNYNFTPFSMASILNMNYINGINNINAVTVNDYAACNSLIRNNHVIRFLSARNYNIVNYSIFDLAGNPSPVEYSLLPLKTKLISDQTLWNRMIKDIGWHFYVANFQIDWLVRDKIYGSLRDNNQFLNNVKTESSFKKDRPRFIYAHFEMPHWPFYYDLNNRLRNKDTLIAEQLGAYVESYTHYIPYVNAKIAELVNVIQQNTHGNAVIIIMGDHGYRVPVKGLDNQHYFNNLNAVYFPDKNYALIKDSTSGVNQFRMIFNSLFMQSLPFLSDSTVFLTDIPHAKS